jgi:AbiU2
MAIPPALGASWKFIWNEVADVHALWKVHEQLFGKGEKRIDLLNACASNFFAVAQEAFLLAIQLKLSKLGDPAMTGKYDNMTLAKLSDEIKSTFAGKACPSSQKLSARLDTRLQDYASKSEKVRERRNKYFAHSDHATALNIRPVPLLTPTREEINGALESLRSFMRVVETHFGEPYTSYNNVSTIHDGESLIVSLKYSLRYQEMQKAEKIDWFDFRQSPWNDA